MFNREWKSLIYGDLDLSDRFLISNDGLLFSLKTNKILKQNLNKEGYYTYVTSLGKRGTHKAIKIHKAVALMFVDGYKDGLIINHKDGNKKNNLYTNLEWVTAKENTAHSLCHFDTSKIPLPSTGYRYIHWRSKRGIYEIVVKHKYVGQTKTLEEAIKKRDEFCDNE